jgi:hypothetical protein
MDTRGDQRERAFSWLIIKMKMYLQTSGASCRITHPSQHCIRTVCLRAVPWPQPSHLVDLIYDTSRVDFLRALNCINLRLWCRFFLQPLVQMQYNHRRTSPKYLLPPAFSLQYCPSTTLSVHPMVKAEVFNRILIWQPRWFETRIQFLNGV